MILLLILKIIKECNSTKDTHKVTVRNRCHGQKAYGKASIVYKLTRKKNTTILKINIPAFKIQGISYKIKKIRLIGWEKYEKNLVKNVSSYCYIFLNFFLKYEK